MSASQKLYFTLWVLILTEATVCYLVFNANEPTGWTITLVRTFFFTGVIALFRVAYIVLKWPEALQE